MQSACFRWGRGFGFVGAPAAALLSATPAQAAFASAYMTNAAPIAIAAGAIGFGIAATVLFVQARAETRAASHRASQQLAQLRAELDDTQAILEGMPEVTLRWRDLKGAPSIFGPASAVLPEAMPQHALLEFNTWLATEDAELLRLNAAKLRSAGEGFSLTLSARDGRRIRASGRMIGGSAVLRLRVAAAEEAPLEEPDAAAAAKPVSVVAEAILAQLDQPAIIRDGSGATVFANRAARTLTSETGRAELFSKAETREQLAALDGSGNTVTLRGVPVADAKYDVVLMPLADGSAACLRPQPQTEAELRPGADLAEIGSVIDALSSPVAVFDGRRLLVRANKAFEAFWECEPGWLKPGMSEQSILDRLRTRGVLPAEVDYRAWRAEHLKSYGLKAPRETLWHLPDGRAVMVSAVPAASTGGVIYVYDDQTEQLALQSRFNALNRVQNETLNALSEGVAVFGRNGRLTLSNPHLSIIWKLPTNKLDRHPHIDEIASLCAEVLPEDGARIWKDLKQIVIDLDPRRADLKDRIKRADGRLIDYAAVRLPDGQTLLTFVDVTESASYQRVLKERNDALITADRLKDAFVQNVSYEFRSPLTNIIGFADILANGGAGELNEKQKSYTEYIRASSATLGLLIDNILDLATVDAGIAELDLAEQSIETLVDQARAGIGATLSVGAGSSPLNLVVDIAPDLPVFVADGTRIVQVLYNLLSNAARFSEGGSEVRLSVKARGSDRILFIIEDEGVGIPDDIKSAMFQRFEGQTQEGRQRGAGLGLTIVRTFVNLHGGTISVEDRKPKGTRVTVNLPARADQSISGAAE